MTSHTLALFKDGSVPTSPDCTFCRIVANELPAHVVYQDEHTAAFLDILPLRRGHTLVVPRSHVPKLSDLSPSESASLAASLVRVARAVEKALGDERLQVICNQVYAQVEPHVHFHIVPAPTFNSSSTIGTNSKKASSTSSMALFGGHGREELDDEDAQVLVLDIRRAIESDDRGRNETKARL